MRLTLRARLLTIVGVAAIGLTLLLGAGALIARRVDRKLTTIQDRLLPKLELEPQLEGQFERIRRGFQDAVAARDVDALVATRDLKQAFSDRLSGAGGALDPTEVGELSRALDDYYASAYAVSQRLIDGETGEALVDSIREMQAKQVHTTDLLRRTVAVDREALTSAFSDAQLAEKQARSYQLWISLVCLGLVMILSLGISRSVLRALSLLTAGFKRFGKGEFDRPIPAQPDELGEIARHANQMAEDLARHERERLAAELALRRTNGELEAFSYSVAHDLRAPLRGINGLSRILIEDASEKLDAAERDYLNRISAAADRMGELIDALLSLSKVTRSEFRAVDVSLTQTAEGVAKLLQTANPERAVEFVCEQGVSTRGDPILLRALFENLLGNAWKFTSAKPQARITVRRSLKGDEEVYSISDDGAGFDMAHAEKLFAPFQRLHSQREFAGTGVGLATVQRIVERHGGRIWAESAPGKGATFHFTLSNPKRAES